MTSSWPHYNGCTLCCLLSAPCMLSCLHGSYMLVGQRRWMLYLHHDTMSRLMYQCRRFLFPSLSPSLYNCYDRRLLYASLHCIYCSSKDHGYKPVICALLPIPNHSSVNGQSSGTTTSTTMHLGVLMMPTAVHESAFTHNGLTYQY